VFNILTNYSVREYIHSLTLSINHALAISYRRNPFDTTQSTYVAHISLVKGVPFYGYNVGYKTFLKVYLLNPNCMTRLGDLLVQGAILARPFQPFEAHLQYLAQWMCDYNLFGCGYIDCEKVLFRTPVPDWDELDNTEHQWHSDAIPREWISDASEYSRQSHCAIEIDVRVQDIMNRREVRPRHLHHDFLERFQELGPDEKFVHSVAGLWRDETLRRKRKMGITDPTSSPFPPEVLVSMSADPRAGGAGGWIHEEEYGDLIEELIQQEKSGPANKQPSFDSFVQSTAKDDLIQTAFESIQDLYPANLLKRQTFGDPPQISTQHDPPALVNEESIPQAAEDNDSAYDSDEDAAREIALTRKGLNAKTEKTAIRHDEVIENHLDTNGDQSGSPMNDKVDDSEPDEPEPDLWVKGQPGSTPFNRKRKKHSQNDTIMSEIATIKRLKLFQSSPPVPAKTSSVETPSRPPREAEPQRSNRVAFDDTPIIGYQYRVEDYQQNGSQPAGSQGLSSSQLSQGSIKAQGPGTPSTLSFSVVKNANESDAALRLSQRSEWPNSKTGVHTPKLKNVHDGVQPNVGASRNSEAQQTSPITPYSVERTSTGTPAASIPEEISELAVNLSTAFMAPTRSSNPTLLFTRLPPTFPEVSETMLAYDIPPVIYRDAYYSNDSDVPERPREYAGKEFRLESNTVPYLPEFDSSPVPTPAALGRKPGIVRDVAKEEIGYNGRRKMCSLRNWEIASAPPSRAEVEEWLKSQAQKDDVELDPGEVDVSTLASQSQGRSKHDLSQIEGPTQKGKHGFKYSQKAASTSVRHQTQYMSIMSLEVHINTRGHLSPDPAEDEIQAVFWRIQVDDSHEADALGEDAGFKTGMVVLSHGDEDEQEQLVKRINRQYPTLVVDVEETELDLLNQMITIVRHYDPDILTGYEVHNFSWGYLIERARLKYEFDLCDEFSRMKSQSHGRFGKEADRWGFTHTSTIRVTGRHMINVWRAMRGELNLLQYTLENVAFHVLHRRIPHYSFADISRWYKSGKDKDLRKTIDYFLLHARLNLDILDSTELIARTSEQARLLGVDFFSVFSRGSQFKVESLMFRIAKPENYILVSPSRKQVGQQNALECLPLVMEPQSAFYTSPLLVLDFQSLYPSVMIAYNYCYSTCLGRIVNWRGTNKLGFTDFKREKRLLELLDSVNGINIAPNGLMYVKPALRKSLLAKMLSEILETRIMVKSGMKQDKQDKTLQRLLNNRQLALKLIANVTYGYTSASFSGRMPCAEIADSIVQTGRETLEKAIALIHSVERWGAEVVYGDTDSLFVYLKGRTRAQAFELGREIADVVTKANPRPVKLKFEKVYHPCVLLAKKRYVGFKYESPSQIEPEFDAKGIETVRRDGTPAEQKIEEKALKILFRTADLSQVKRYFQSQCRKIMQGRVSIQDFLFAKEVKLGNYSDKGPPPPGALIATRRMLADPRREPQYGERVPYVVVTGAPGARLIDRCVDPEVLLKDEDGAVELDAEYYIGKNLVPPLERIFNLVGANVRGWWEEMPKVQRVRSTVRRNEKNGVGGGAPAAGKTLESYLHSTMCIVCRARLPPPPAGLQLQQQPQMPLCETCVSNAATSITTLRERLNKHARRLAQIREVCRSCSGLDFGERVRCDSRDCPVFYTRVREESRVKRDEEGLEGVIGGLEVLDLDLDLDVGEGLRRGRGALEW
jgi:DNA polymerase zeta